MSILTFSDLFFNAAGQSVGYVQGSTIQTLFNGAVSHSGDDTAGSSLSTILGDNEHITIDFGLLPPEAATIVIGVLLVSGSGLRNCYVNVLPLLRQDSVSSSATTVEYESDSEDESTSKKNQTYGSQQDDDGDDELILLYKAKLDEQHPNFVQSRGFLPLKFARINGSWQLIPLRQITLIDNQYGLWPAIERASQAGGAPPQYSSSQPQLSPQPQYSQPQFQPQGGYGVYPQQCPYQQGPGYQDQGYQQAPGYQAPGYQAPGYQAPMGFGLFPDAFGGLPQQPQQQYPQQPYGSQNYGSGYQAPY